MADYHRILSYLYRYDKNDKKECRGFVKAEQKRSGLKLTIQIEDDRLMEDMSLDLCFYQKKDNNWEMWKMDQLAAGNHQEETTLFYPAERLPDDFDIRRLYGILFLYRDSFFYGSVWIGDEIPIAALMDNNPKEKEVSDDSGQGPESPEQDLIPQENPEEQLEEKSEEEEKREAERESEEEEKWEPERRAEEEELSTDSEDLLMKMWIDTEKMAKPVDNIFNKAFRQGYKISVEQLKKFSPEAARMAENQFLLKGYNRYQHLLAGKVMYAGRERYCIGVPGIYENRERYMAEIYQFPVFLSLTENRIKTGGFGYWLHLLQE
ncbi:MAG: DUF6128 domain-containing protein [Anaerobutyricum sp.]|nr:DUF6128 domain-containing protein [Anaerobutyricum sp.]